MAYKRTGHSPNPEKYAKLGTFMVALHSPEHEALMALPRKRNWFSEPEVLKDVLFQGVKTTVVRFRVLCKKFWQKFIQTFHRIAGVDKVPSIA